MGSWVIGSGRGSGSAASGEGTSEPGIGLPLKSVIQIALQLGP
jgi:hypothetical protein